MKQLDALYAVLDPAIRYLIDMKYINIEEIFDIWA
jgi:hypothetical protein